MDNTRVEPTTSADSRAVSPVIGVILMIAITVVLSAVVGTFVLGMTDSVEQDVTAGVTVAQTDNTTTVTWIARGDATSISVGGVAIDGAADGSGPYYVSDTEQLNHVGEKVVIGDLEAGTTLTIVAASNQTDTRSVIRTVTVRPAGAGTPE